MNGKEIYPQEYTFAGKVKFPDCQKHGEIFGAFILQQLFILEMLVNPCVEKEEGENKAMKALQVREVT